MPLKLLLHGGYSLPRALPEHSQVPRGDHRLYKKRMVLACHHFAPKEPRNVLSSTAFQLLKGCSLRSTVIVLGLAAEDLESLENRWQLQLKERKSPKLYCWKFILDPLNPREILRSYLIVPVFRDVLL